MTIAAKLAAIRAAATAPENVPANRVFDLHWAMGSVANDLTDPYEPCRWLCGESVPRLLYNAALPSGEGEGVAGIGNGAWVVTHYEDIERVYTDNAHFSNDGAANFQALIGETFRSIPLGVDPPDHARYRQFLVPHFSPASINRLDAQIRAIAVEMIDSFVTTGEVDIAWDFGRVYPVRIFMNLMGFPEHMFEQFLDWEWDILHSNSRLKMAAALRDVLAFLRSFIAEKQRNPDATLVSKIVHGKISGRAVTDEEQIGIVWFLWLGGLDTVAATISQMFRRMALEPEIQRQIRNNPELVGSAVEEFLRTQPILSTSRTVTEDFEWHGIQLKQGDKVSCLNPAGNFDPDKFADAAKFDPSRRPNRHFTFVAGVHLCLGAPLARRELRILLDEWLKRVPEFRIKPGTDTTVFPGLLSIRNLPIVWDHSVISEGI
ncbi:cytochrome P450 [Novosphingobium sp. G106]|uniref:cytochrome P450 n=1 Tax=Novosphingobium sp. G106 TaxID=2849500 RepID=UPI001C2D934D|nr:cytochrome P450 [Novosphingobium sp. G106]MBV1686457.1 cytochrome P450 [Novosphingobium sp. G106]